MQINAIVVVFRVVIAGIYGLWVLVTERADEKQQLVDRYANNQQLHRLLRQI